MNPIWKKYSAAAVVILLVGACEFFLHNPVTLGSSSTNDTNNQAVSTSTTGSSTTGKPLDDFTLTSVEESNFQVVAETPTLELRANPATGQFIVHDKRNGHVFRSFPDPATLDSAAKNETAKQNLLSPLAFSYVVLNNSNPNPVTTNFAKEQKEDSTGQTKITDWKVIPGGFQFTFQLAATQLTIPVQVHIQDDYVETRVIDSGIKEGGPDKLVYLELYPFFGAEESTGQPGYLFVPDGSGALINFVNDRLDQNNYTEPIYGPDMAFPTSYVDSRVRVKMPVYGMRSGDQGFLAVIQQGAEYDQVVASPSPLYTQYNWITAELDYRKQFQQPTSHFNDPTSSSAHAITAYNTDRFKSDRVTRYYLLDTGKEDYVGMAERYRQYLMDDVGLKPIKPTSSEVPLYLNLVGGDYQKGFLYNSYVPTTTTAQATDIVKELYNLGITNMNVTYSGWQFGGNSAYGNFFPVDPNLGGNDGMKSFISYAHSLNIPVYLDGGTYIFNSTNGDGFHENQDAARVKAGYYMTSVTGRFGNVETVPFVSPKVQESMISNDLKTYKSLGANGISFTGGLSRYNGGFSSYLYSDYNPNYTASRGQAEQIQQDILKKVDQTLGGAQVNDGNFYDLGYTNYINQLDDDDSYDLLTDNVVPFAEIALHGLVNYSSVYGNLRNDYKTEFLRSIEYGADPNFLLTYAQSQQLIDTNSLWYYSTYYKDWESTIVKEYQDYNKALGDVQDKFIVGHQQIAPGVNETTYSNGKSVIVNYNTTDYTNGNIHVPAQDFIAISKGGLQ